LYRELRAIKKAGSVTHLMGKFRRFYLVYFRKGYVQRQLKLRKGECHQCGRCCSFLFVCPMLTEQRLCRIYRKGRLEICRVFPIDERDVNEVALHEGTCGYFFEDCSLRESSRSENHGTALIV
jgi:hypothetical protein